MMYFLKYMHEIEFFRHEIEFDARNEYQEIDPVDFPIICPTSMCRILCTKLLRS